MSQFEIRQNIIPGMILNSLLIWDVKSIIRLHDWQEANASRLKGWLKTIDVFDALTSLATFADHNPKYTWPTPIKENIILDATGLGHPLLKPEKRIVNDICIKEWSEIAIITGANMAGKSTFLRSLGLNFVLAGLGCPVTAENMQYYPLDIYTSMRTTDSLLMEESYFLAELKRLAKLMERLRSGEAMLVLLDEMLKGTNSTDKLKGSQYLVRELTTTQSATILATHDVQLTEMEKLYPDHITNYCFEIVHDGDELVFDYKLRPGIVRTMNASLLMKKMGIIKSNS
jgi:DNA mismatch repair ATPase MutS